MWYPLSICFALTVPLAVYCAYIFATVHLIRCAFMASTLPSPSMIKGYTVLVLFRLFDWLRTTTCSLLSLGILRAWGDHNAKRATVVVKDATTQVEKANDQDDCPICMEHTSDEHAWCKCRQCNHSFHTLCLESWVKTGGACCPTCRRSFSQSRNDHAPHEPHTERLITVTEFRLSLFEFTLHVVGLCIYVAEEAQLHTDVHKALVKFCLTGLLSTAMTVSIIVGVLQIAPHNMMMGGRVTESGVA